MKTDYCGITIPENLIQFCKCIEDEQISNSDVEIALTPDVDVMKDSRGRILSVCYYSPEHELQKQVFYDGMDIASINYFNNRILCCSEKYDAEKLVRKDVFKKDGEIAFTIRFAYVKGRLESILKKTKQNELLVKYSYDELSRVISRNIFVDDNNVVSQEYSYDILDRIVQYKDENQRILVRKISKKNELLTYVITDKIGNEIIVNNLFTDYGYVHTELTLNGHGLIVKDTSYVDNIMLKKPYASDEDLDLIISNLFKTAHPSRRTEQIEKNSMSVIDANIESKTLPISIRKRLLFNLATRPVV